MKLVKIAILAVAAAGSLVAVSCCPAIGPAPAPTSPIYVPAK